MTDKEWRNFVMAGTRTGQLATVRPDGRPHAVPIWFELDGEDLVFMTHEQSVKARNIQAEPRVVVAVDEISFPYAFVSIEGRATFEAMAPEALLPYAIRIARRYVGDARAEAFGKRNAVAGELLVRVAITKVLAASGIAD